MADATALPGAADIAPIAGGTGGDSNSQLMNVLTALLHANPPATSIDQASEDTKATANANAAAVEKAKPAAEDKKADVAPASAPAKTTPASIPNTLTDSILNMNQIMPVSKSASAGTGDMNKGLNNILDMLGGDAGKGAADKGGDASKLATTLHSVAKLAALFA